MAAPLLNGARLGFGVALIGVLLAETKLSNQGIGFVVMDAYRRFDMPRMYALLILAVAFAAAVNLLAGRAASPARRPTRRWEHEHQTPNAGCRGLAAGALAALPGPCRGAVEARGRAARQLGHVRVRTRPARGVLQEAWAGAGTPLYRRRRRDAAGGAVRQRGPRPCDRIAWSAWHRLKERPVRIISAETTGAADLFWYVPTASPLKTVADLAGKTVAFSAVGSSTNTVGLMVQAQSGVPFKLVGTGGLPATFTATMSNQIDVGWSAAPFGVDALQQNKIRVLFRGSDVRAAQAQTVRVNVTHASVLAKRRPVIEQYIQAYRETLDWMYSSPDAIKMLRRFCGSDARGRDAHARAILPEISTRPRSYQRPRIGHGGWRETEIPGGSANAASDRNGGATAEARRMSIDFADLLAEVATANRILAHHGVVDAFGHVSVRHPAAARPFPAGPQHGPGRRDRRRHHGVRPR